MRELLLSLGVWLGVMSSQPDPELALRLFQADHQLCATVEVRNAIGGDALALLRGGNTLELAVTVNGPLAGQTQVFRHRLVYDPIGRLFTLDIAETGRQHRTSNGAAAVDIFRLFYGLRLGAVETLVFPARLQIQANLGNVSDPGSDIAVLWNYRRPEITVNFSSLVDYTGPAVPLEKAATP